MPKKSFAVFDIDGTLIRWQLYHVIVDKLASQGHLGRGAEQQLRNARMTWKRREHVDAFKAYEMTAVRLYEAALQQLKPKFFDSFIDEIIEVYKDQTYTYTRDLLKKLKSQGYQLFIISGSHKELIEHIGKHYGFDDWIGSDYKREKGRYTGHKYIASLDKATALKTLAEKHKLDFSNSLAIGDSASDIAMLELVENPIAFNPETKLFATAKQNGWPIVIERKNIVYKLEQKNGKYVLA